MQALVDKLRTRIDKVVEGGGEKAIQRHTARGWQKLPHKPHYECMTLKTFSQVNLSHGTVSMLWSILGHLFWSCRSWPATNCTAKRRCQREGLLPALVESEGWWPINSFFMLRSFSHGLTCLQSGVHDIGKRCHGEGRQLLPHHREETPACPGCGSREQPSLYLPRWLGRSQSPEAVRSIPRPWSLWKARRTRNYIKKLLISTKNWL